MTDTDDTKRPTEPGAYRKALEKELATLEAKLEGLNERILELEIECDATVDDIDRVNHSLARLMQ